MSMVMIGLAPGTMLILREEQVDPGLGLNEAFAVITFVLGQEVFLFHLVGGFAFAAGSSVGSSNSAASSIDASFLSCSSGTNVVKVST